MARRLVTTDSWPRCLSHALVDESGAGQAVQAALLAKLFGVVLLALVLVAPLVVARPLGDLARDTIASAGGQVGAGDASAAIAKPRGASPVEAAPRELSTHEGAAGRALRPAVLEGAAPQGSALVGEALGTDPAERAVVSLSAVVGSTQPGSTASGESAQGDSTPDGPAPVGPPDTSDVSSASRGGANADVESVVVSGEASMAAGSPPALDLSEVRLLGGSMFGSPLDLAAVGAITPDEVPATAAVPVGGIGGPGEDMSYLPDEGDGEGPDAASLDQLLDGVLAEPAPVSLEELQAGAGSSRLGQDLLTERLEQAYPDGVPVGAPDPRWDDLLDQLPDVVGTSPSTDLELPADASTPDTGPGQLGTNPPAGPGEPRTPPAGVLSQPQRDAADATAPSASSDEQDDRTLYERIRDEQPELLGETAPRPGSGEVAGDDRSLLERLRDEQPEVLGGTALGDEPPETDDGPDSCSPDWGPLTLDCGFYDTATTNPAALVSPEAIGYATAGLPFAFGIISSKYGTPRAIANTPFEFTRGVAFGTAAGGGPIFENPAVDYVGKTSLNAGVVLTVDQLARLAQTATGAGLTPTGRRYLSQQGWRAYLPNTRHWDLGAPRRVATTPRLRRYPLSLNVNPQGRYQGVATTAILAGGMAGAFNRGADWLVPDVEGQPADDLEWLRNHGPNMVATGLGVGGAFFLQDLRAGESPLQAARSNILPTVLPAIQTGLVAAVADPPERGLIARSQPVARAALDGIEWTSPFFEGFGVDIDGPQVDEPGDGPTPVVSNPGADPETAQTLREAGTVSRGVLDTTWWPVQGAVEVAWPFVRTFFTGDDSELWPDAGSAIVDNVRELGPNLDASMAGWCAGQPCVTTYLSDGGAEVVDGTQRAVVSLGDSYGGLASSTVETVTGIPGALRRAGGTILDVGRRALTPFWLRDPEDSAVQQLRENPIRFGQPSDTVDPPTGSLAGTLSPEQLEVLGPVRTDDVLAETLSPEQLEVMSPPSAPRCRSANAVQCVDGDGRLRVGGYPVCGAGRTSDCVEPPEGGWDGVSAGALQVGAPLPPVCASTSQTGCRDPETIDLANGEVGELRIGTPPPSALPDCIGAGDVNCIEPGTRGPGLQGVRRVGRALVGDGSPEQTAAAPFENAVNRFYQDWEQQIHEDAQRYGEAWQQVQDAFTPPSSSTAPPAPQPAPPPPTLRERASNAINRAGDAARSVRDCVMGPIACVRNILGR